MNVRIRFVVYKQKNDAPAKQIIRFYLIWILRLMNFTESTTFNITRETCGPGFAYPSSAYSTWDHPRLFVILIYLSIFFYWGIRVAQSLVSHVVFCKILFVFFFCPSIFSLLSFNVPICIFRMSFTMRNWFVHTYPFYCYSQLCQNRNLVHVCQIKLQR